MQPTGPVVVFPLRQSELRARRLLACLSLAIVILLAVPMPVRAQGALGNPDSENLGGRGPGDMVVVYRGGTPVRRDAQLRRPPDRHLPARGGQRA